jgi:hypothetical protein
MSMDAAVVAQRARVSPAKALCCPHRVAAFTEATTAQLPHHAARRLHTVHTAEEHRPAPEPVARSPTTQAPTIQGRRTGFPTLHTGNLRNNEERRIEATGR